MHIFDVGVLFDGFHALRLKDGKPLMDTTTIRMIETESHEIRTDAFSIAYAPEYYVLSYHFTFPRNANADLRPLGPITTASIAIKRGFKLVDPFRSLINIKSAIVGYANDIKDALALPRLVASKFDELYALVEPEITTAPEQAMINWSAGGDVNRAVVAFDNEEQLSKLLDSPFRNEFRLESGHGIIFLIYRKQAISLWPRLKDRFKAVKIDRYDAAGQVEIVFPDGHTIFVENRDAEIDYTCSKTYHKSYHFKGSLSEKWDEWKVRALGNRCIIGLPLEPEVREYQVRFVDAETGKDCHPDSVKVNLGKYDAKKRILKLSGEEHCQPIEIQTHGEFQAVDAHKAGNKIIVKLEKRYAYPTEHIWETLAKQGYHAQTIYIEDADGGKRFRVNKPGTFHFPLPHEKAYILFPETEEYLETKCKYDVNPQDSYELHRKHYNSVVFYYYPSDTFPPPNRDITLKYYSKSTGHQSDVKEVTIDRSPFRLEHIPDGQFCYVCEASGYKRIVGGVNLLEQGRNTYPILLDFTPTPLTKVLHLLQKYRWHLLPFIVPISFLVGFSLSEHWNGNNIEDVTFHLTNKYSDSLTVKQDSIESLKVRIDSLQQELEELKDLRLNKKKVVRESSPMPLGVRETEQRHPNLIKIILQMPLKDKPSIKQKSSYVYNKYYSKLSNTEKQELEQVFRHPAWNLTIVPNDIETIPKALQYLNNMKKS